MRRALDLLIIFICISLTTVAQTIENPIFDRIDSHSFRLEKIEITNDTTYLYCSFSALAGSWANISEDTYLLDTKTNKKYPLLKSKGLPYAPQKRIFLSEEKCEVTLCFPSFYPQGKLNLIEIEDEKAFNIYGVNIDTVRYNKEYKEYEISRKISQRLFYADIGDYEKAIPLSIEILEGVKYLYGIKSEPVYVSLSILSSDYYFSGNIIKAIDCMNEVIEIVKSLPDCDLTKIVEYTSLLSVYYDDLGKTQKAIDLIKSIINNVISLYGKESFEYANVLIKLSKYHNNISDYSNALLYADQACKLFKESLGEQNEYYVLCLSNYANAKSSLGDYDEAIDLNHLALNINSSISGKYDSKNALFLGNISYNYDALGNFSKAIEYGKRACSICKLQGVEDVSYVNYLDNVSLYYFHLACEYNEKYKTINKDYLQEMINYSDSAEMIASHISSYNSYIVSLLPKLKNNKSSIYFLQGNYDMANRLLIEACSLFENKYNLEYASYLENLAISYLACCKNEEAIETELIANDIFYNRIRENLKSISEFDISSYWQSLNRWYNFFLPKLAYYTKDSRAISILYNETALFSKGFLLNSNLNIKQIVLNEGIQENVSNLNQISQLYEKLDNCSSLKNKEDSLNYQIIKKNILERERELINKSKAYRTYIDQMDCNWEQIMNCLKNDEIAIEFVRCPIGVTNDSILYVALSLKNGYHIPRLIPLFYDTDIKLDLPNTVLYDKIWKPLKDELDGVSNIFFSPTGVLHKIGIEYLTSSEGYGISNNFDLYRLSSTRELLHRNKKRCDYKYAVLFGGINYEINTIDDFDKSANEEPVMLSRGMVDKLIYRGGFEYLNNTLYEVLLIDTLLMNSNIKTIVYNMKNGSEENFKKLSNKAIDLLHISTHGVYINYDENKYRNDNNLIFTYNNNNKNGIDEVGALTRSFLMMSGGNRLIKRMPIKRDEEDGILTALEISRLNLSNINLVVLSACQTALGDIHDEGVYGLQRGFKKAGANTILMSLDKVDDEATKILMVEFYRNLMSGKSKHQSLKDAQKYLRQVDNGRYDKPEYWASFIMLDGLN